MKKKRKPAFNVPNAGSGKKGKVRVKDRWRKPKGVDNKKRIRKKSHGALPRVGYKNSGKVRGLHPSGKPEVLVASPKDLEGLKGVVIRVKHGVGKAKRLILEEIAAKLGLKVLNPLKKEAKAEKQAVKKTADKNKTKEEKSAKSTKSDKGVKAEKTESKSSKGKKTSEKKAPAKSEDKGTGAKAKKGAEDTKKPSAKKKPDAKSAKSEPSSSEVKE